MSQYQLVNPELLGLAGHTVSAHLARFAKPLEKRAFVPGNDPMAAGMGGDPAAAGGGAPPPGGDPSMMGGGGGAPPPGMDAAAAGGGGGGGMDSATVQAMVQQAVQQAMAQQGGGAGGAGGAAGGIKPKIDVNSELMQIKNLLAKLCDANGVQIPAQDMVATPEKLQAMAAGASTTDPNAGAAGGAGGGMGGSAIQPIQPMPGASPGLAKQGKDHKDNGVAFNTGGLQTTMNKAAAVAAILSRHRK